MNKELREKLIDAIIDGEVKTNSGDDDWFLREILREGHGGYENMDDDDLVNQCEQSGIDPLTGESVDEDGE